MLETYIFPTLGNRPITHRPRIPNGRFDTSQRGWHLARHAIEQQLLHQEDAEVRRAYTPLSSWPSAAG
jgi:hypothetical protein